MRQVKEPVHQILYKDVHAYCAHPHIVRLPSGELLLVFNQTVRRPLTLHPPEDPRYYNLITRSTDGGQTWISPRVAPGYDWYGVECAGLTVLASGRVLLNQWRFSWLPLEKARKLAPQPGLFFPEDWAAELKKMAELDTAYMMPDEPAEFAPWARCNGGAHVHISDDGGWAWEVGEVIDTLPYLGGYGMRGGIQMPDGDVLLPLCDVPDYARVFVVRSSDEGKSWSLPLPVAAHPDHLFEEPCALLLDEKRVLIHFRDNRTHSLYQSYSSDGGFSWSTPQPTGIQGYPSHLLRLPDSRILCTIGVRSEPFSIQAIISNDEGKTWCTDEPWLIRGDLPNRDLGYPATVLLDEHRLLTVYYAQDGNGVTCIQSTMFDWRS